MITSTAKAQALIRDLSDKLSVRFKNGAGVNTVRISQDANGMPFLFLSHNANEAAGQPVIAISVQQIDMVSKDVFGNPLLAYAPHQMLFAYELDSGSAPIPSRPDITTAEYEAMKLGVQFNLIELANTTAVTAANVDAATPVVSLDDLYWPTKGV